MLRYPVRHGAVITLLSCVAGLAPTDLALAGPPTPSAQHRDTGVQTITVEATRDRAVLERRLQTFVKGITTTPYLESLAQWQKEIPICPEVAGLPFDDGEYVLSRLSQIARDAGATLAPENCASNLRVVVSSVPDELVAEWSERRPWMFGSAGGTTIHQFLHATAAVRVWYNTSLFENTGRPCKVYNDDGIPRCEQDAQSAFVRFAGVRDFTSVIVVVDARKTQGLSMGQLAAYVGMVGLAEIRVDARLGDAPTILRLFADSTSPPPPGLTNWDQAYLKALYHTPHDDKTQLLALKASMLQELAPIP